MTDEQLEEKRMLTLQEECSYLTKLIQQHKLGRINPSQNSQKTNQPKSSSITASQFKKVNNVKSDAPMVDKEQNKSIHGQSCSVINTDSPLSGTIDPQRNYSYPLSKSIGSASRSSKMYLNPSFFKVRSETQNLTQRKTSVHINPATTQQNFVHVNPSKVISCDSKTSNVSNIKPTVHVNPAKSIDICSKLKTTIYINPAKARNICSESVNISTLKPSVPETLDKMITGPESIDAPRLEPSVLINPTKTANVVSDTVNVRKTKPLVPVNASKTVNVPDCLEMSKLKSSVHINPRKVMSNDSNCVDISKLKATIHINPAKAVNFGSQILNISKKKPSVHINPLVLSNVLKQSTKTEMSTAIATASHSVVTHESKRHVNTSEGFAANKSMTQNYTVPQNHNISGIKSQFLPKKRISATTKYSHTGPLMSISRTKLVRAKLRRSSQGSSVVYPMQLKSLKRPSVNPKVLSSFRVRRNSVNSSAATLKVARAVRSKYKLSRSSITKTPVAKISSCFNTNKTTSQQSKYKIDRRLHKTPRRFKKVKTFSLKYELTKPESVQPSKKSEKFVKCKKIPYSSAKLVNYKKTPYSFTKMKPSNYTWNNPLRPRRVLIKSRKLMRIGYFPNLRNSRDERSNPKMTSLVRIGGVLYRTSKLKLTKSDSPSTKKKGERKITNDRWNKTKKASSFAVYVRGNKFLMDVSGKTLLRVTEEPGDSNVESPVRKRDSPVKRIDIGGVTYVQKSTNVLIRTNTHTARNVLSQAKQKSIALLTKKLRKNNQPCIFYHRFGKCVRKEKGTCPHVHDPKQVAICRKFLQGCCEITGCTLSHDVGPEKMPTCTYFLQGCCVRDNCPYLHVKVNAKASICKNFLSGYCPDGNKCKKRHTYICPEFEKAGKCSKGKYCPYPHKTLVRKKPKTKNSASVIPNITKKDERKRYYETGEITIKTPSNESEDPGASYEMDNSELDAKRQKLLKKVNDMKRSWLTAQQCSDLPSTSSSDNIEITDEPRAKRPKLGPLPAYIPLGSDPW